MLPAARSIVHYAGRLSASHAARWTALAAVGSQAVPVPGTHEQVNR
jgi:hypothetical protein